MVEYTKALERSLLKELGKLPPYLRKKEALIPGNRFEGAGRHQQPVRRPNDPAPQSAMASAFAKLQQGKNR